MHASIKSRTMMIVLSIISLSAITMAASPVNNEVLVSARAKGKSVADYWVNSSGKSPTSDYYADACSFYGSIRFGEANGDSSYYKKIYNSYKNRSSPIPTGDVDKNSAGLLPLYLFTKSRDSTMLKLGKAAADASVSAGGYKRYAIDDTYMTGSLMIQAYRATGDTKYLDFCANYILQYMDTLLQPNGLYWHRVGSKVHWCRGNGWGAASTTELLLSLPPDHPKRAAVLAGFKKHMNGLLAVQKASGMWMQVLTSTNSKNFEETSGTGMFLFAMFSGLKNGWLDSATFLEPAKKGWNALAGYVGADGKLKNICVGFWGDGTENSYLNAATEAGNAHGTCAFLWAAAAAIHLFTSPVVGIHEQIAMQQSTFQQPSITGANVVFDLMGRALPVTASSAASRFALPGFMLKQNAGTNGAYLIIR
jgi:unsaturated rhamnogalacturonyl hydrolase